MDLRYSETYQAFRSELRAFLKTHWPLSGAERALAPPAQARLFRQRATEAGYYARAVPRRYGGSEQAPDVLKAAIIAEEVARAGAPAEVRGSGTAMLVPTLLEHGTPVQCERFVPPTLLGDLVWCQGYSEPGAGSDLASLRTRAELRGDHWVINGQKIWTSLAHEAHWMFCLCRTEPDAPKHGGISYLLIDMKTPGLEVRPLRQMTGTADFNEVFFTDVRVPKENLVGARGEGWKIANTTLKHERNMIGDADFQRVLFESLLALARERKRGGRPAIEDLGVRQQLAEIEAEVLAQRTSMWRQMTAAARRQHPGPVVLMNKLNSTQISLRVSRLAVELLEEDGLAAPGQTEHLMSAAPTGAGGWISQGMWALGLHIGGGTAHIQRNIIAERGLGLPKDRRPPS